MPAKLKILSDINFSFQGEVLVKSSIQSTFRNPKNYKIAILYRKVYSENLDLSLNFYTAYMQKQNISKTVPS